jgi:putative ATP-dependent endonuclease of OLD family
MMKIKSIEIQNFRSIRHEVVDCINFNAFVGPNGAGKSTVLNALNIFFGEIGSFSDNDFHNRNTEEVIKIKVTFHDLSEAATEEFSHYVRSGQLVVQAEVAEQENGTFKKSMRGERLIFQKFKEYFEAKGASSQTEIFKRLREEFSNIDAATSGAAREAALNKFENDLTDDQKELTASGEDFFGVSKGAHKFQKHICWVYVPAVKDAASEAEEAKTSHLGKLIQHTIRSRMSYDEDIEEIRAQALEAYTSLLSEQKAHLTSLQSRLSSRLKLAVMTDADLTLDWKQDDKSVSVQDPIAQVLLSERGHTDKVEKFGHGLQRSFLLVILQELMAVDTDITPTLLLGCEEPELYQHPPQAKHLAEILKELSQGDAQVFITTHSPYFVDVDYFDGIKMLRNTSGTASVFKSKFEDILSQYNDAFKKDLANVVQTKAKLAIQIQPKFNEIFFADRVVLVEGISDQASLETYLHLSGRKSEFRKSGNAIIVCEGKSSLALMLLISKSFNIPYHVIFDCDSKYQKLFEKDADKYRRPRDEHIRDNAAILMLAGHAKLDTFPDDHIFKENLTAWHDDIEQTIEAEYDVSKDRFLEEGIAAAGQLRGSKKNPLFIAASMSAAWDGGIRFRALSQVVEAILKNNV